MNLSKLVRLFELQPEIQTLDLELFEGSQVKLDCLRLDKIHPFISGNKWYKLKYHLQAAIASGKNSLLSFGGAYSNHLHALAYAGKLLDIPTIGIVRGSSGQRLTPTLEDCTKWGMSLHWLNRQDYRQVAATGDIQRFAANYANAWVIPEGGAGELGMLGVRELFSELHAAGRIDYDYIACPVGSGATLAGIASAEMGGVRCLGYSALKGAHDLEQRVESHFEKVPNSNHWQVCHDYHFGGFAKVNDRLTEFIAAIRCAQDVLLDPVYTGKMFFGLAEWVCQGRIKPGSRILAIHTGGLQGWRGVQD